MVKFTKRQATHWDSRTDESLARLWLAIFVDESYRVQTGARKGQLRNDAIKLADEVLEAASRRNLSLPCEGESFDDWTARIERNKLYGDI